MSFKTFYFTLWMFFIFLAVVKGSCLEYGHSCLGAHGKRSGSSKMYHTDIISPTEADFQDLNGLNEKTTYDSTEEQINSFSDSLSANHDIIKDNNDPIEVPDKRFKKLFYKKFNKTNKKQRFFEPIEHIAHKSHAPMISGRWRPLPLYNLRRITMSKADNDWLKELEREAQTNEDNYI